MSTNPKRQWHCHTCRGDLIEIRGLLGLHLLVFHIKTKGGSRFKLHRACSILEGGSTFEELRLRGELDSISTVTSHFWKHHWNCGVMLAGCSLQQQAESLITLHSCKRNVTGAISYMWKQFSSLDFVFIRRTYRILSIEVSSCGCQSWIIQRQPQTQVHDNNL